MYLANAKRHLRKQTDLHSRNAVNPVMEGDSATTSETTSIENAMERFSSSVGEAWESMLALFSSDDAKTSEYTSSEGDMESISSTDAQVSDSEGESAMMESDAIGMTTSPVEAPIVEDSNRDSTSLTEDHAIVEDSNGDSISLTEDHDNISLSDLVDTATDDNAATHVAKCMYVVIKMAMAVIANRCVTALHWISRVGSGITALVSPHGASAIFAEFPSVTASASSNDTIPSSSRFGSSTSSSAPPNITLAGGALQTTPVPEADTAYDEDEGNLPEGFTSSMFVGLGDALYREVRATPVPPRLHVISRESFQNVGDSLYRAMLPA